MSEVIVITSGKGGVGKTTTSANVMNMTAEEAVKKYTEKYVSDYRKDLEPMSSCPLLL